MNNTDWTPAEIAHVEARWPGEETASQIGGPINRSESAVRGLARRLGLPARPSPLNTPVHIDLDEARKMRADNVPYDKIGLHFGVSARTAFRRLNEKPKPPRIAKPTQQRTRPVQVAPTPAPEPVAIVGRLYTDISDARLCQYPLSAGKPWIFCDAEAVTKGLCTHHYGVCWIKREHKGRNVEPQPAEFRRDQMRAIG